MFFSNVEYYGYLAGFLTVLSFIPPIIRCHAKKNAEDLQVKAIILLALSTALWSLYHGYKKNMTGITITGSYMFMIVLMAYTKIKFDFLDDQIKAKKKT